MPKRTNEFQQLITLVQRSLAPKGAIVVESAMVENAGIPREIDVLVKLDAGMYKIKIAVEAKDHKRKIDIKTIEELIGKYRNPDGIQVNQVVLVARKGFSKTARARAKQVGIKLFTFDEAIRQDWDHLVPTDKPHRIAIDLAPHLALVEVVPAVSDANPAAIQKEAHVKCLSCGQCNGSPWRMAKHVLADIRSIQKLLGHAKLETTMIYTHVMEEAGKGVLGVVSPLDRSHRGP